MLQYIRQKIDKEMYDKLEAADYKDRKDIFFGEKGVPAEWECGYGYYGFSTYEYNGEYFISHRLGESCD